MKVIGLTGGIASGKSTVSNYLRELGATIVDADIIARNVVEKGQPALKEIVDFFGEKVLKEDGTLDREYLGSIVFADAEKLRILSKITHERIIDKIKEAIKYHSSLNNIKAIFIDAALLIEAKLYVFMDEVWLVTSSRDIQVERLMLRDGISFKEAMNRISSQMCLEKKKEYADVILDNSKDLDYLKVQVEDLYKSIFGGA